MKRCQLADLPSCDLVAQRCYLFCCLHCTGQAVPCAIFAFLKCSRESFEALIPYAISLGGDTDTIASMAGAIGGAYWGLEAIPEDWVECCEESSRAVTLADQLFRIVVRADHAER